MTTLVSLAARFPLTLSPKERGKRKLQWRARANGVDLAERTGRDHPLPLGARAGVRGNQPC